MDGDNEVAGAAVVTQKEQSQQQQHADFIRGVEADEACSPPAHAALLSAADATPARVVVVGGSDAAAVNVKAVLFDADGTLIDSLPPHVDFCHVRLSVCARQPTSRPSHARDSPITLRGQDILRCGGTAIVALVLVWILLMTNTTCMCPYVRACCPRP